MTLKFACPDCGQHISAQPEQAGQSGECPSCGESIVVPGTLTHSPPAYQHSRPPAKGSSRLLLVIVVVAVALGIIAYLAPDVVPDRAPALAPKLVPDLDLTPELPLPPHSSSPTSAPDASDGQKATQTEFLAMQGIAKRIEEFMRVAEITQTKAMVPGRPAADGGFQIIILSSELFAAPATNNISAERDPRKIWMLFAMSSAAAYTKDSPRPITSIAFADTQSLKDRIYYVLDMTLARDLQQKLKSDHIKPDAAYAKVKAALKRTVAERPQRK